MTNDKAQSLSGGFLRSELCKNAQCPIPNAQCPMPNAQCPVPNAQYPITNDKVDNIAVNIVNSLVANVIE
ncbi:hypothetical protein H6G41_20890 [Tolypothrix sp. FACHB-123]|uniref:hypothetical protein n=1 Tax=Tolypothrix sp. FACHB-123 TaxID=2692868 RepID=UPI001683181A|nr:hypothetical protein [Tolypothrix sp. FACHB-123]MBD2357051.1 hypothetical protein [Tolypothrix sp. FACHB-123]